MKIDFDIKKTVKEAFRAGNRARKKESVQDTVESVDKLQQQIDKFREQTGIGLEIVKGKPYCNIYLDLENCKDLTELPDGLTVRGFFCLNRCTGLTKLPDNMTVNGDFYLNDCINLTSLPHGLTVKGCMYLKNCKGLTSFPADLIVKGTSIYRVPESLFPFFKSIGVEVRFIGGIYTIYTKDWMDRRHMVNEAFRAGNRARRKESVQDTVDSDMDRPVTDPEKVAALFKDIAGRYPDVTRFERKYAGTFCDLTVWDAEYRDNVHFIFWTDSPDVDNGVKVLMMSDKITGSKPGFDRESYCSMIRSIGFPVDEELAAHKKPRFRMTTSAAETVLRYVVRNQELHIQDPDDTPFITEAFRAGNRARKKESVQDVVTGPSAYLESEDLGDVQKLLMTGWKAAGGEKTGIKPPVADSGHDYDEEAGIWWGPDSDADNPFIYRICCMKTADIEKLNGKRGHMTVDEMGDAAKCTWVFDLHVRHADMTMSSVRLYNLKPWSRYGLTNVLTYPLGANELREAFEVLGLIYGREIYKIPTDLSVKPENNGYYTYLTGRFALQTYKNHTIPIDDSKYRKEYFEAKARRIVMVGEAFRAGNRARKKEAAADAMEELSGFELYVPEGEMSGKEVVEAANPYMEALFDRNGFSIIGTSTYLHPAEALWTIDITEDNLKHFTVAYVHRYGHWALFVKIGLTVIKFDEEMIGSPATLRFLRDLTEKKPNVIQMYYRMIGSGDKEPVVKEMKDQYIRRNGNSAVNMNEFYQALLIALFDHYGVSLDGEAVLSDWSSGKVRVMRVVSSYTDIMSVLDKGVSEAFKAGNQARKKEAVQDTVQQVGKDLKDEDIDRIMDDLCGKYPEVVHRKQYYHAFNGDVLEIYDYDADDNAVLVFERPSEKDDGTVRVLVSSYRMVYTQGSGEQINKSYKIICNRLIDDNVDSETVTPWLDGCMMFELTPGNVAAIYRYAELCNSLTEAFRAGNLARKKESAVDTAESVDGIPYPDDIGNPVKVAECLMKVAETALVRPGLAEATEIEVNFLNHDNDDNIVATVDTTINGAVLILIVRGFSTVRGDTPVRPISGPCIGGIMSSGRGDPYDVGPSDSSFQPGFKSSGVKFWPVSDTECWKSLVGKYREDLKTVVAEAKK